MAALYVLQKKHNPYFIGVLRMETAVHFPNWRSELVKQVPPEKRRAYSEAITKFLYWLRQNGRAATLDVFREHVRWKKSYLPQDRFGIRREALLWYYREGMRATEPEPTRHQPRQPVQRRVARDIPLDGSQDLGRTPWEKALVRRLREKELALRTEHTYRSWCRRFMAACGQKPLDALDHGDIRRWLSDLVVKERVAVATQKQALNAVVFFFREVLQREPGDFSDFTRSRKGRKVPAVLTQEECARLFAAMSGTSSLMAKLMYAGGLRLSELLRLRVKDMDLDRLQMLVQFGKGRKSRYTMIPPQLEPELRAHRERLRELHRKDRDAGLPGVYVPEGLARKWPKCGEKFIWYWFFPSRSLMQDPRTGIKRRHHVLDVTFQKAVREGARRAQIDKQVTPHTLRHSFATHLLASGTGIRDVQDLMGHADVSTTQIYLHTAQHTGVGIRSPFEFLESLQTQSPAATGA